MPGFPAPGTSMTLSINWNRSQFPAGDWRNKKDNKDYYVDDQPCSDCHRLLCAAKKCGLEILLCDQETGEAKPVRMFRLATYLDDTDFGGAPAVFRWDEWNVRESYEPGRCR